MDDLLVPVSSRSTKSTLAQSDLARSSDAVGEPDLRQSKAICSAEHALDILKSHPQQEVLLQVLQWLHRNRKSNGGFKVNHHPAQATQITYTLVNDILPDHWSSLFENSGNPDRKVRDLMISALSNVPGISALVTRMKVLVNEGDNAEEKRQVKPNGKVKLLEETLSVLVSVLNGDDFMISIWSALHTRSEATRSALLWKELVTLLGNGRVLSIVAEADQIIAQEAFAIGQRSWLSDGSSYSSWIGRNLFQFLMQSEERLGDEKKAWAQMLERAVTIGHIDQLVEAAYHDFIHGDNAPILRYQRFTMALKGSTRRAILYSMLRILVRLHWQSSGQPQGEGEQRIGVIAALLHEFIKDEEDLISIVPDWLTTEGVLQDIQMRRAVVVALAQYPDSLKSALSDSLSTFGDKIRIRHTPILHQEGTTENLLLLVGIVYRKDPQRIVELSRSSLYLNAISNRLSASSHGASVLGMYVGTAVSELVDPVDKRMAFGSEELKTAKAQRFLSLTKMKDELGSIGDLERQTAATKEAKTKPQRTSEAQDIKSLPVRSSATKGTRIISIEEVESEAESEDGDLPTYAKPDSDASDSDEDPTLINRDKPSVPVYIDDLISGLRDTESYDRHLLALTHAASLIRRKASFGTEVTDNIQDLASILTGLADKWNLDNFQELRLQGMIAVLVAQPLEMGQWFSRTYFNGDYSISQRAAVLTTLGLGARELAGYGSEDSALTKSDHPVAKDAGFPSKQLPPRLHKLYVSEDTAPLLLTTASKQLEQSILRPMALDAADALSGPNALKIRTFSSRMQIEKKRSRPIPNALAKVVAEGFFLPLTARWSMHVQGL
ncbi:MAG: hypothetical protein Q9219_000258 [cf. Caloplaca sp. 3 TL-2023]